jgi:hypothetical protein
MSVPASTRGIVDRVFLLPSVIGTSRAWRFKLRDEAGQVAVREFYTGATGPSAAHQRCHGDLACRVAPHAAPASGMAARLDVLRLVAIGVHRWWCGWLTGEAGEARDQSLVAAGTPQSSLDRCSSRTVTFLFAVAV